MKERCGWVTADQLYIDYHDREWGVPLHDDHKLFEMLILEGAQAGLSWLTVLKKRNHYREAFDQFDPRIIAEYGDEKIAELLQDSGIIRNRLKIQSAIINARKCIQVQEEFGSLDAYLWQFVDGKPIQNKWSALQDVPARTKESDAMSKDLTRRGFKFVGSTICYAFMQATGMVNDHLTTCFRHDEVNQN